MRKKKQSSAQIPSDPLDDLPVLRVMEEPEENDDDDDDDDDDSDEQEPDEDKHASSGLDESTPQRGTVRKELNLPSGVRSGNIPIVPGELDDEGKPIRRCEAIGRLRLACGRKI